MARSITPPESHCARRDLIRHIRRAGNLLPLPTLGFPHSTPTVARQGAAPEVSHGQSRNSGQFCGTGR
jgi:hypothetical protein